MFQKNLKWVPIEYKFTRKTLPLQYGSSSMKQTDDIIKAECDKL
jgi:hypothetical protein